MPTYFSYPTSTHFTPDRFEFGLRASVMATTSSHNGSTQTIEMPGSRWVASLSWDSAQNADLRAEIEAYWARVRGQANRVQLYHMRRPTPRGTLQSNTTFSSSRSIGEETLTLAAATNLTLLAGDMLGHPLTNQLFMVVANATSVANVMTVTVTPKIRVAISSGSVCSIVRPTANFMLTTNEVRFPYEGYTGAGFAIELMETYL